MFRKLSAFIYRPLSIIVGFLTDSIRFGRGLVRPHRALFDVPLREFPFLTNGANVVTY